MALKEGHADTRARWTANTMTCSDFQGHVPECRLPALELMFKAEGDKVEKRLQGYIRACGYPRWLTVVTGPLGSFREEHILSYLETHLEPWTEDRQWRILLLDAYAPPDERQRQEAGVDAWLHRDHPWWWSNWHHADERH